MIKFVFTCPFSSTFSLPLSLNPLIAFFSFSTCSNVSVLVSSCTTLPFTIFFSVIVVVVVFLTATTLGDEAVFFANGDEVDVFVALAGDFLTVDVTVREDGEDNGFLAPAADNVLATVLVPIGDFTLNRTRDQFLIKNLSKIYRLN